jgi:putative ABC transport system permease protein
VEWDAADRASLDEKASPERQRGEENHSTLVYLTVLDAREYYEANKERLGEPGRLGTGSLDLWRQLGEEKGRAIVSDNFALMFGVRPGDSIRIGGDSWTVIGTVPDYNWIRGTIFLDRRQSRGAGGDEVNTWEIYLPPGADAAATRDRLQKSSLAVRYALLTLTRDEVRDLYLRAVYNLCGLAYTQEVVIGIVAVLGVMMALVISVLSRQRELGLLRAVGATRWQVLHTVLAEAALIGLVGTLLGILVGLPLEWYVVRVILFEETGFLFPVRIPWLETGMIAFLAIFSATLAGLMPAVQAVRLRITEAIAYE